MRPTKRQPKHSHTTLLGGLDSASKAILMRIKQRVEAREENDPLTETMGKYSSLGVGSFRVPRGFTIGIIHNWIWFRGWSSLPTEAVYKFLNGAQLAKLPVLFLQRSVLEKLTGPPRHTKISLLAGERSATAAPVSNSYNPREFNATSVVGAASSGPVLSTASMSAFANGGLIPASLEFRSFCNDPFAPHPTDTLATPLLPRAWWREDKVVIRDWGCLEPCRIETVNHDETDTYGSSSYSSAQGLDGAWSYTTGSNSSS